MRRHRLAAIALAACPSRPVSPAFNPVAMDAPRGDPPAETLAGPLLAESTFGGDHSFSDSRIALTRSVLAWLEASCAPHLSGR